MPFQPFVNARNSRVSRQALLTIYRGRVIGLNAKAVEDAGVKDGHFVVFHFDREVSAIGLAFTRDRDKPGSYRLTIKGSVATVGASAFLDHLGIKATDPIKFPLTWDETANLWVATLPTSVVMRHEEGSA